MIVAGELLMDVDVIAHSRRTDSEALREKSLTILSSLGFCDGSYLHFCLRIFKMANCKISPISSTAWKLICCSRYLSAFSGLLLCSNKKAFLLVERSVSLTNSSST